MSDSGDYHSRREPGTQPCTGNGSLHPACDAEPPTGDGEQLRALVDNAPTLMGVVELTPDDSDILHVLDNTATEHFFGVGRGGTAGRQARRDLGVSAETARGWITAYREAQRSGRPARFPYAFRAPTDGGPPGSTRWLDASVSYLGPGDEGRDRFCYIALNDTERRLAEEVLARAARADALRVALSDVLRPLSDPVAIQAEAARVVATHLGARRAHYGEIVDGGECGVVEADYYDGVPSAAGRYRFDDYGPMLRAGIEAGRTIVVDDASRDQRLSAAERDATLALMIGAYVLVSLVRDGRPVAVLAVHQDVPRAWTPEEIAVIEEIAERTRAAVEQARAERALRESERRYRALFESVAEGFCIVEAILDEGGVGVDYRFLEVNPAFERLTGLAGAAGRTAQELMPGYEPRRADAYGRIAVTGERMRFVEHSPARDRWFEVDAFPIGEPQAHRIAVLFNDITERTRTQRALEEAHRRKDEFLATLAHELRNPLAPLRSGLEILRLAGGDPAILGEAMGMMERQLHQMVHLIDDLLDVSRISRGKIELRRERVELAAVVHDAVETTRPLIAARGHALRLALPPEPVPVDADPVRLAQIFANLLHNAAKFTDPAGHLGVIVTREAGEAVVRVCDDGAGIAPEALAGVFDLFSQARSGDGGQGGLGIGLHIVQQLTQMHGGRVEATSPGRGRGSEFIVRLPLAGPPRAAAGPSAEGSKGQAPYARRILVADDNHDVADGLALMLRLMGNEVRAVYGGIDAVAAAEEIRPEVLILDIGMPDMDGHQAARRIRGLPWGGEPVLIALTGWGQEEDRRRSREAGFDHHLVKPLDVPTLKSLLAGI